jgi:pimeloyl-ACP methyl ester carboxylesterase
MIQGGGDSTCEEMYFFGGGAAAARRGFNVLLYEGPGMPGTACMYPDVHYRYDWEKPVGAVVDYLMTREDVDPDRLAIIGYSFGGHLVSRAATFEKRIRACISNPLIPNPGDGMLQIMGVDASAKVDDSVEVSVDQSDPIVRMLLHDLVPRIGASTVPPRIAEVKRIMKDFSLWGLEGRFTCDVLNISGSGEGRLTTLSAQRFMDGAASKVKKFVLFTAEDGAEMHCQKNNPSLLHQAEFDWLEEIFGIR